MLPRVDDPDYFLIIYLMARSKHPFDVNLEHNLDACIAKIDEIMEPLNKRKKEIDDRLKELDQPLEAYLQLDRQSSFIRLSERSNLLIEDYQLHQEFQKANERINNFLQYAAMPERCGNTVESARIYQAARNQQREEAEKYRLQHEEYLKQQEIKREEAAKKRAEKLPNLRKLAEERYGLMHPLIGAVVALAVCLLFKLAILYMIGMMIAGAYAGYFYRQHMLAKVEKLVIPEDVSDLNHEEVNAFHDGVEAKTWLGLFAASKKSSNYSNDYYKSGLLNAMTDNQEVIDAVEENYRRWTK